MRGVYWFDDAINTELKARGIQLTRAESFVILNMLMGVRRGVDIARNLGVSRQATAQLIQALEARGYATTTPDPHDARARIVSFSTIFDKHAPLCDRLLRASERELERRIGKRRVDAMRSALFADWGPIPRVVTTKRKLSTPQEVRTKGSFRRQGNRRNPSSRVIDPGTVKK